MQRLETKNSRPRQRLKKTGLETRFETETKSQDSITGLWFTISFTTMSMVGIATHILGLFTVRKFAFVI